MKNKKIKKKKRRKLSIFKILLLLILLIILSVIGYFIYGTIRNGGGTSGLLTTAMGQTKEEIENLELVKQFCFISNIKRKENSKIWILKD